ncbi:MAG: hypothetical protein WCW01_03385 [Gammaproteobacteria bacterium]
MTKIRTICSMVLLGIAGYCFSMNSFADATTDTGGGGMAVRVKNAIEVQSVVNDKLNDLFYNPIAKNGFYSMPEQDSRGRIDFINYLQTASNHLGDIALSRKQVDANVQGAVGSAMNLVLANDRVKAETLGDLLLSTQLDRDSPLFSLVDEAQRKKMVAGMFSASRSQDEKNRVDNDFLSAMFLLGPTQYSEDRQKDAQNYLRYSFIMAKVPTIIALPPDKGTKFVVPFAENNAADGETELDLSSMDQKDFDQLRIDLPTLDVYKQYKANYRTQASLISMLIGNLLQVYQSRMPTVARNSDGTVNEKGETTPSLAELEKKSAYARTTPYYYHQIEKAPSIVVQREMLMLLADINRRLYEMQQTEERALITDTLLGLQSVSQGRGMTDQDVRQLAKYLVCRTKGIAGSAKDHASCVVKMKEMVAAQGK